MRQYHITFTIEYHIACYNTIPQSQQYNSTHITPTITTVQFDTYHCTVNEAQYLPRSQQYNSTPITTIFHNNIYNMSSML